MSPSQLLEFSVQMIMILTLATSLRHAYFTLPWFEEFRARMEARAEGFVFGLGLALWDPITALAKILSCRTCFTWWLTGLCALFVCLALPHLPQWVVWTIALPSTAWSINHLFDPGITQPRVFQVNSTVKES